MLNKNRVLLSGLFIAILAGCSNHEDRKLANGEFDYLEAELAQPISTQGIGELARSSSYDIPPLGANAPTDYVGQQVDVRSPVQILPVLEGTRVDESAERVTVTFTSIDRSKVVKEDVWALLTGFLSHSGVNVESQDKARGELTSGWFEFEDSYGAFWNKTNYSSKEKYKFLLNGSESSRTASLGIELLSVEETVDGDTTRAVSAKDKVRYEKSMINRLLVYGLDRKNKATLAVQSQDNRVPLDLGFDDNGQLAWLTDTDYDKVWNKLPIALKKLNFTLIESNKVLGSYEVSYKRPSSDFWAQQRVRKFDLRKGTYTFRVGQNNKGDTVITVLDSNKKHLSKRTMSELYLSIVDLMQQHSR